MSAMQIEKKEEGLCLRYGVRCVCVISELMVRIGLGLTICHEIFWYLKLENVYVEEDNDSLLLLLR